MNLKKSARGFSLVELVIAMGIGITMTVVALPIIQSTIYFMRMNAAVASVTGAISDTRYHAIMNGYPYEIAINKATLAYQISDQPGSTGAFANVGNAVPITGDSGFTMNASTTFEFLPNGTVTATVGTMVFTLTYEGMTKTITVSGVGRVQVQ